jgi:hypothetical protein
LSINKSRPEASDGCFALIGAGTMIDGALKERDTGINGRIILK